MLRTRLARTLLPILTLFIVVTPMLACRPALAKAPDDGWLAPLEGAPVVVRGFEPPPKPWMPGHRGVDLAAAPGSIVRAAGAGVIHFAGQVAGRPVVSIDHPDGLRTTYEPVVPQVPTGGTVALGEPIGLVIVGHDGCPVIACLHWGLRNGQMYLNPLGLLRPVRVRLYPLTDP